MFLSSYESFAVIGTNGNRCYGHLDSCFLFKNILWWPLLGFTTYSSLHKVEVKVTPRDSRESHAVQLGRKTERQKKTVRRFESCQQLTTVDCDQPFIHSHSSKIMRDGHSLNLSVNVKSSNMDLSLEIWMWSLRLGMNMNFNIHNGRGVSAVIDKYVDNSGWLETSLFTASGVTRND